MTKFKRTDDTLQRANEELEERLRFETLLAELSAHFVNLPSDRIDSNIEDAQRRICELLDLDRATLWQVPKEEPGMIQLTHFHQPPETPTPPERMKAEEFFPWTIGKVLCGKTVAIEKMTDLPLEADRDRESYRLYGTKSTFVVPLSVGGEKIFGVLSFAVTRTERKWPETITKGLHLIAEVFANALARRQAETALRENEARLRMATNAAGAGLWTMEIDTGAIWCSEKARQLFHFASDEALNFERFFKVIHPEDRERVHQAVQQAIHSAENLRCDYRIILPDGRIRWIVARGHLESVCNVERLMGVSLDITERKRMETTLEKRLQEIQELRKRLESENIYLQEEVKLLTKHKHIVGQSAPMKKVLSLAEQVAVTDSTVFLLGETGTGKELMAKAIHSMSLRKDRPLITINCASLPPTLIESELFGREKGAYTGAMTKMIGRFEIADGSTLFLDEIGEFPLDLQSKLLRVLEEGEFERLGSTRPRHVNVRIIAATNRDIEREVRDGKFRQDLFYRLNVFPIVIPPLRERSEDIPLLVRAAVKEFQWKMGKEIESIPKKTMQALQAYSWPGNVRELRNVIEHAMILSKGNTLDVHVPNHVFLGTDSTGNLEDIERRHIVDVLEKIGWRVAGPGGAAEILGLKRTTLQTKMKKLGINRPSKAMPE